MGDAAIRTLVRLAERSRDPVDVARALRALAQVGRFDEAGMLHLRAGPQDPAALDDLALSSVEVLQPRTISAPGALKRLSHVTWAPDGRTVYAAVMGGVVALDEATGALREVAHVAPTVKALSADPEGKRLLLSVSDGQAVSSRAMRAEDDLQVIDLEAGALGPRLRVRTTLLSHVAFVRDDPDVVLAAGRSSVDRRNGHWLAAYRLKKGKLARKEPLWRETAPLIGLGAAAFVSVKRGKLGFHELAAPAAPATFATPCRNEDTDRLAAAGSRAVVVGEKLWLISRSGDELGSSTVTRPRRHSDAAAWLEVVASPTGRQLAVTHKSTDVLTLVDVTTGGTVEHRLGARPRRPAWSPSGRKLVVSLDGNVVMVLGADDGPPGDSEDEGWIRLAGPGGETWAGRCRGATFEHRGSAVERPGGTRRAVQAHAQTFASAARAKAALTRHAREKQAAGWRPVRGPRGRPPRSAPGS